LFIVGPFLVVGWISAYKGSESMSNEVGRTTLQLVKQHHVTLEKTLSSVNARMITLLDNYFFSDTEQFEFWTRIETLGEMTEADAILERWASDGTEFTLFMANEAGNRTPFDLSNKTKGFKYFDENRDGTLEWVEQTMREGGAATLGLTAAGGERTTVSLMRSILNPKSYDELIGFLIVSKLEVVLNRDLVTVQLPEHASIFLYNGRNELLMRTGTEELDQAKLSDVVNGKTDGYYYASEGGQKWLYAYSSRSSFDTRLIYKIPFKSITASQSEFQWILMIASAIYLVFVLLFVLYLLRMIVKPLVKLVSLTKIYEPGKTLDWDQDQLRKDEFGILYGAFKKMTTRLDHSIEENYGMKIKQKEIELATLHSQITPHLLYNTLDSIYWYALSSGNADVGDMVKDLSKLLRIGLSKGKTIITIGEELEHVQAYSRLQMKRYPNTFEMHWDVDETLLAFMSPKVIIQPLVENAIFHGVSGMDGEGEIWVRVVRDEGEILVTVEDNGFLPIDMKRLDSILAGETSDKGYGIRNVHQRIRLHFGEAYGLRYERREGGGLRAVINMPLRASAP
jgi:two-component system sensor histidine kinase YesM